MWHDCCCHPGPHKFDIPCVCAGSGWLEWESEFIACTLFLLAIENTSVLGAFFLSILSFVARARRWCFRVFAFVSNSRCGGSLSMQAQLMHVVTHRWICCKRGEQQKIPLNMHDCAKVKSCDKHLKPIHWKAFVIVRSRKCACAWM